MKRVLLTGATGYVGGRLRPALEQRGVALRCLVRRPGDLQGRVSAATEIAGGDLLAPETLGAALAGIDTAYYLVHSMGSGDDFAERDRQAADNFGHAARQAGVSSIVYLGGLGDSASPLSPHLSSRQETGERLRASGVPVIEFRASVVIGSGSLSFEMIRSLVERLPVMICPRWVSAETQPIAVEDLIAYLLAALDLPSGTAGIFEIGGPDRVTYGDLMKEYARQRTLRRTLIPVPLLTPRLSSLWLGLVTPLYARVGRKLIDSLRNRTVVESRAAAETFSIRPRGIREAIARAIGREDREVAETRWSDAFSSSGLPEGRSGTANVGTRLIDSRAAFVSADTDSAFGAVRRIGGSNGWYYANLLWRARGYLDLIAGGVGLRRGRRDPENVAPGDALDFWRVEAVEPGRLLRLVAEMKLPGRAWLQFETTPLAGGTEIRQTAIFDPHGLPGLLYWWALYPFHRRIFGGMLAAIARRARAGQER
ncbi:MAG TPA: SDR family oxidoreductase [Thermoanaerobaculia bacterium]|nr:SDR family oxidoreductase [Thermoanaerobaculia bacterium]